METARAGFASILEWILAAAVIAVAIVGVSLALQEIRTGSAVPPVLAGEAPPVEPPALVPSGSVSVPMLLLADGKEVRVGDDVARVTESLGTDAQIPLEADEPDAADNGLTRFYEYAGTRFVLVFRALSGGAEPTVAAIYVQ